jgi:hypothetical protein
MAASGRPNKLLTITVNPERGNSATERRDMLHDAWKRLGKRILRQFALAPEKRWTLKTKTRTAKQSGTIYSITSKTKQRECEQLHYFAFLERTKAGEPHLHILLRCPFVPQDWLSEQLDEMIGAPICWIEAIANTKAAVSYVTKYVTKEPAQFGNRKRYWHSKRWEVEKREKTYGDDDRAKGASVRLCRYSDWQDDADRSGSIVVPLDHGWLRQYARGSPDTTLHCDWDWAEKEADRRAG